jgi:hypothetical protein
MEEAPGSQKFPKRQTCGDAKMKITEAFIHAENKLIKAIVKRVYRF